jgi:hypothetical protein
VTVGIDPSDPQRAPISANCLSLQRTSMDQTCIIASDVTNAQTYLKGKPIKLSNSIFEMYRCQPSSLKNKQT